MKVRYKEHPEISCISSRFNMNASSEVIVYSDDGSADSSFIKDLDVLINDEWIDMGQAFKNKDIITDNYNTIFFKPENPEDKKRGYTL